MDLSQGMAIFDLKIVEIHMEQNVFNLFDKVDFIGDYSLNSFFSFNHKARKNTVANLMDLVLNPLIIAKYNIKIDVFVTQNWVDKFLPICSNNSSKYAILNLIRLDFAERSLSIYKGKIIKEGENKNESINVMSIEEYINKLPEILCILKKRYYFQLGYCNYITLLVINDGKIKSYFEGNFFFT